MDIKLRIISVNENDHSMVVRFYTEQTTEDELATTFKYDEETQEWVIDRTEEGFPKGCRTDQSITIYQTPSPTGDELLKLLVSYAPIAFFKLQEKVKDPEVDTTLLTAKALATKELVAKVPEPEIVMPTVSSNDASSIEDLIKKFKESNAS